MEKIIRYSVLIFVFVVVSFSVGSCFPLDPSGPSVIIRASLKSDSQKRIERETRVRRNRENIQSRYYARDREDTCSVDTGCRDDCGDLYDEAYDAYEECLKLRKTVVEDMKSIIRALENPSEGLQNIDSSIFTALMALSVEPWIEVTRSANREDSELILSWIAQKRDISEAVHDYGSSGGYTTFEIYEGLRELLKSAGSGEGECAELEDGLTTGLNDGNFNFCSIAQRTENEYVVLIVENLQKAFKCNAWSFDPESEPCSISVATAIEEILENPTDEYLALIKPTDLEAYLRDLTCSDDCWESNQYGARKVLRWIANTPSITEVFRDLDTEGNAGDFQFLRFLLGKLSNDYKEALSQSLDNGKSFMENAIPYQNQEALEWIHDFFARGGGSLCSGGPTEYLCIFRQYCDLEWSSNPMWQSLLALENFNNFIERILHSEQPGLSYPDWWETKQQCTVRIRRCEEKCDNSYGDGCAGEVDDCQSACTTAEDSCRGALSDCKSDCDTDKDTCVDNCAADDENCKPGCNSTFETCKQSCESKIERCDSKQEECSEKCDERKEECDEKLAECQEACQVPEWGCRYLSAENLLRDEIQWMCRSCTKTACTCDSDDYCPYPPP